MVRIQKTGKISPALAGLAGAVLMAALAAVALVVPVIGVRGRLSLLFVDWQEAALLLIVTGGAAAAGALLGIRRRSPADDGRSSRSEPPPDMVEESSGPVLSEPQTEELVRAHPTRRLTSARTRFLLCALYLLLYFLCAVLCRHLHLGIVLADRTSSALLRSTGLALSFAGFYLIIRQLSRGAPAVGSSGRLWILARPALLGWLVLLAGIPLVYQAWFPLIALPGIYVVMTWLFR